MGIAEDFLRLRHKMIPFLYSANHQTHALGIPLCMPMYYRYDQEEAYQVPNQYLFGDTLLVCPVTTPTDKRLNLAKTNVWLPEGRWTDIFTGQIYDGGKTISMYRDLDSIPVLAPAGAIVPMFENCERNDLSLSQPLEIHIWSGNGSYTLYEDDGVSMDYESGSFATTLFSVEETDHTLRFTIHPSEDCTGILPKERTMILRFRDITAAKCSINGATVPYQDGLRIITADKTIVVELHQIRKLENRDKSELRSDLLTRVQGENIWKALNFNVQKMPRFVQDALKELDCLHYE